MNLLKKDLRKKFKFIREAVTDKSFKSNNVFEKVSSMDEFIESDTVFLYAPSSGEVETRLIAERAEKLKKKTAFPLCLDKEGNMEFYYSRFEDLKEGMYGIKEPPKVEKAIPSEKSLCFVPGLAFDKSGFRLGYGKGYYDRFLKNFGGISIGLSYEEGLCEILPRDTYDMKLNYLITDKDIYKFN